MANKETKRGEPGQRPVKISVGDRFKIDPNDFLRVPGVGKFVNRGHSTITMEFEMEDIRNEH